MANIITNLLDSGVEPYFRDIFFRIMMNVAMINSRQCTNVCVCVLETETERKNSKCEINCCNKWARWNHKKYWHQSHRWLKSVANWKKQKKKTKKLKQQQKSLQNVCWYSFIQNAHISSFSKHMFVLLFTKMCVLFAWWCSALDDKSCGNTMAIHISIAYCYNQINVSGVLNCIFIIFSLFLSLSKFKWFDFKLRYLNKLNYYQNVTLLRI